MYRYQIINADNQILRFITVAGDKRLEALAGKVYSPLLHSFAPIFHFFVSLWYLYSSLSAGFP